MAIDDRLGQDLRLLADLASARGRDRGTDLRTVSRGDRVDLDYVSGAANLAQALLLRFLTPLGELAALGHPTYGSRLYELIGELNNDATRNRAKLFVLKALQDEPRVAEVLAVTVSVPAGRPDTMQISVQARPVAADTPVNLVFPFFLGGGVAP